MTRRYPAGHCWRVRGATGHAMVSPQSLRAIEYGLRAQNPGPEDGRLQRHWNPNPDSMPSLELVNDCHVHSVELL